MTEKEYKIMRYIIENVAKQVVNPMNGQKEMTMDMPRIIEFERRVKDLLVSENSK